MFRLIASALVLLLGAASGAGLAACGDEESDARLLPAKNANEIERNLTDLEKLLADCQLEGAADAAEDIRREIAKVEDQIEPELRENLLEGVDRLEEEIAAEDCDEPAEPTTTEEEEPAPVPTEETTEETEEEPTTTTQETEEEPETTEEPPPTETTQEPAPAPTPTPAPEPDDDGGESAPPSGGVGPGQSAGRSAG